MKTTIEHEFYGRIRYDTRSGIVTVQRGLLAERLNWLLKPENEALLGPGYHPDKFLRACEVLGILEGAESIKTEEKTPLPKDAVQ